MSTLFPVDLNFSNNFHENLNKIRITNNFKSIYQNIHCWMQRVEIEVYLNELAWKSTKQEMRFDSRRKSVGLEMMNVIMQP